jgi:NDP-sugar pyrophosphorylase family protein
VGHLGDQIQAMFGDGAEYGVQIDYAYDGPRLLGTGGAIQQALPLLGEQFLVMYGDSYLPIPFTPVMEAFVASGRLGLMTVYANEGRYDTSNVWFDEGEIKVYDKSARLPHMRHIDFGLCAFRAAAFPDVGRVAPLDLAEVLKNLVIQRELAGFEVQERFYEIGSPAGLAELDRFLRESGTTGEKGA